MTEPRPSSPERNKDNERSQQLLSETFLWVQKIIQDKPVEDNLAPLNSPVGRAIIEIPDGFAFVKVVDLLEEYRVEYTTQSHEDSAQDIVIDYSLSKDSRGKFHLTTTGEQPDIVNSLLDDDVDETAFAAAVQAHQELLENAERYATAEEVERFHAMLERATFGDEEFDFDTFEWQLKDATYDREAMKLDADWLAKNNPEYKAGEK